MGWGVRLCSFSFSFFWGGFCFFLSFATVASGIVPGVLARSLAPFLRFFLLSSEFWRYIALSPSLSLRTASRPVIARRRPPHVFTQGATVEVHHY